MEGNEVQISKKAIETIKKGNKIEAIKIVREESSLDLKEAKQVIDGYINEHPEIKQDMKDKVTFDMPSSTSITIVVSIMLAVCYFVFYKLRH